MPLSSEALLFGYLRLHPEHGILAIATATLGNTLGGLTTYALGRLVPARMQSRVDARALGWLRRHGSALTFLAWLPLAGDALCLGAGWLRLNALAVLAYMAAGRLTRYLVVALSA